MGSRTEQFIASPVPYGRIELKRVFQRNYFKGFLVSVIIHFAIIGSYYGIRYMQEDDEHIPTVAVRVLKYSDLGPPPSIANVAPPPTVSVTAAVKPTVGTPVPVPDAEVSPEQTIATQTEMSNIASPITEDFGDLSGGVQIERDITIDDEPGMNEFVPVEKPPQIVQKGIPVYPDMAIRAGIEGTVWVKILVGKDGRPIKAVVIKSTTEMFNDPSIEAAMKFIFTPAYMNQGPVKVWVSFPFRFTLKDTRI